MNKKIILALNLILLISYSCKKQSTPELKKGKVIVAGKFLDIPKKISTITIAFEDAVRNSVNLTEIIDTNIDEFKFEFDLFNPQNLTLKCGKYLTLYLSPGDSLWITFEKGFYKCDFSQLLNYISFRGDHVKTTEEIIKYRIYKKEEYFIPKCEGKTTEQYLKDLSSWIDKEKITLLSFIKGNNPGPEFISWANSDIIYRNANYLIDYKYYLHINNKELKGELFNILLFPVNNDSAIVSFVYGLHLWHYGQEKYILGNPAVMKSIEEDDFYSAYKTCLTNLINNEIAGLSRDIMAYKILLVCFEKSYEAFATLYQNRYDFISNKTLNEQLELKKTVYEKLKKDGIAYLNTKSLSEDLIVGDIFQELSEKFLGKTLYIDIWATWCGPCKTEIPYSIELQEHFKDQNVEFIYLCLNSDITSWEQTIKNSNLGGHHYFFDKAQSELLRSKLKFQGYPTYLLINRKSEIVDNNAPRPSSKEIKNKIDELLNATQLLNNNEANDEKDKR